MTLSWAQQAAHAVTFQRLAKQHSDVSLTLSWGFVIHSGKKASQLLLYFWEAEQKDGAGR